ncbi:Ribosome-releasing factor 2, mitochondrial [Borealophlyctis nickersoniae]|nr:Ribosome-releasing factor 2, mitochondrial [Borealophlyctis nickersoniae]
MEELDWKREPVNGGIVTRTPLVQGQGNPNKTKLHAEAVQARVALVEALSEIDEGIVDVFLEHDGDHMRVPAEDLRSALRRVTLNGKGVPVLCGASFRNIGVQPVLDAVVDYLPSPTERQPPEAVAPDGSAVHVPLDDKNLCALAFKVMHDKQRGPLVYVRVYSGTLDARAVLHNPTRNAKERATKVLEMYADDFEEIPQVTAGNIAAIVGLRETCTGDTLLGSKDRRHLQLHPVDIPPPVFVRSCEPASSADERALEEGLRALIREDPSLHVSFDEETGQTLLSGMGELHLEIAAERLKETHKVDCKMGKVLISYRETIKTDGLDEEGKVTETLLYEREAFGKRMKAEVSLTVEPLSNLEESEDGLLSPGRGNEIVLRIRPQVIPAEDGGEPTVIPAASKDIEKAIRAGIEGALGRGPLMAFPLTNLRVTCTDIKMFSTEWSTPAAFRIAAQKGVQAAVTRAGSQLLEPVMEVAVRVPEKYVGSVVKDLSGTRRGHIHSLDGGGEEGHEYGTRLVDAHAPLENLVGYSTVLRGLTAGTGDFTMVLRGYGVMQPDREEAVVQEMRGY